MTSIDSEHESRAGYLFLRKGRLMNVKLFHRGKSISLQEARQKLHQIWGCSDDNLTEEEQKNKFRDTLLDAMVCCGIRMPRKYHLHI